MSKEILFDDDALGKIKRGVDTLADAVKVTLGPRGRNVALDRPFGGPNVTKDGVSVAREIDLENSFENMGAQTVKEAATRTADNAGDGTTTATVLAQEIFNRSYKMLASGYNPILLKRGMDRALRAAIGYLRSFATQVESSEDIAHVATLSSNGDTGLGQMIAEAMERVGKGGVISVEEGKSIETVLEMTDGMQFDRGYIHPDFVRMTEDGTLTFEDAYVLIANKKLSSAQELVPVLEYCSQRKKPLLVVAHDVEGEALIVLLQNHIRGVLPSCAVKAPRIGDKRTAILEDLATLTGGQVISDQTGVTLNGTPPGSLLGGVSSVTIDRQTTTLLEGAADDEVVEARIRTLRAHLENAASPHDQEHLQKRISQLGGGMAIIRVGATTELELKEYKARVEDALSATRAAVQSGVVPGGGCSLLEVSRYLREALEDEELEFSVIEERLGWQILADSLEAPFRQILTNAGLSHEVLIAEYRKAIADSDTFDLVYDVNAEEFVPCFSSGILDPTLVEEEALLNSVGVAGILVTSACAIAEEKPDTD